MTRTGKTTAAAGDAPEVVEQRDVTTLVYDVSSSTTESHICCSEALHLSAL
jgi:hypothetical protein